MASLQVSFLPEIQSIMYAMGDFRRPLVESAKIIEETILHQMQQYIRQAQNIAEQRNELYFNEEDLIFILRNDRILLQRVINCLKMNDTKHRMKSQTVKIEDDESEFWEENAGDAITKPMSKRLKLCETTLEKMDPTGDLLTMIEDNGEDCIKRERLMRAAAYASSIDTGEYMRFTEARQVSFLSKPQNCRRFREWLFGSSNDHVPGEETNNFFDAFKPTIITLEILNFLAYETMATLMDCSFFVKRECASNFTNQVNDVVRSRPQIASTNVKAAGGDLLPPQSMPVSVQKCPRNSQQVALLLAQQVRNKSQQNQNLENDAALNVAVQPWELREAIRRLRYYNNRSTFLLFGCNNFSSCLLAK